MNVSADRRVRSDAAVVRTAFGDAALRLAPRSSAAGARAEVAREAVGR